MLPRTDAGRETYVCRTRKQTGGAAACAMPVLRREAVEVPALKLFENVALDVAATREQLAAQLNGRIGDVRAQAERAGRDAAKKRAALAKFDRDYECGELGAANYERLAAGVSEELAAAEAQAGQYEAHAAEQADARDRLDVESEMLRRLAELREAIAGRIRGAEHDIDVLRAAWVAVFDSTYLIRRELWQDDAAGDVENSRIPLAIVPLIRREMLTVAGQECLDGPSVPVGVPPEASTRVPLCLPAAADKLTSSGVPE